MPLNEPIPFGSWSGEDVYIIGGGPSLKSFNWNWLRGKKTIGCNSAFRLGVDICSVCFFGDIDWWNKFSKDLESYSGHVYSNARKLKTVPPWVQVLPRESNGLGLNGLGWNGNSGAAAINLALLFGASKIYLLGFDMKLGKEQKANWHEYTIEKANPQWYQNFKRGFWHVVRDLKAKFPDRDVINVTDDSDLESFPKEPLDNHFPQRRTA